jgi:hypothetical protein
MKLGHTWRDREKRVLYERNLKPHFYTADVQVFIMEKFILLMGKRIYSTPASEQ